MTTFARKPHYALLALALTGVTFTVFAEDETDDSAKPIKPMTFTVEPGVSVTVKQPDLNSLTVRVGKGGKAQTLSVPFDDAGGQPFLQVVDYNFDGYKDLAWVLPMGMVNEMTEIFLYDPAHKEFVPLQLPATEGKPQANCDPLSTVTVDAAQKTLASSCRGGPIWTADTYRYTPAGQLYLHEVQDSLPMPLQTDDPDGAPAWVLRSYDANGKQTAQRITAYNGGKAMMKVPLDRLTLHDKPDATPSKRYLVKNDPIEIKDISDDEQWLKVQYVNAKKGVIEGWIAVADIAPPDSDSQDSDQ